MKSSYLIVHPKDVCKLNDKWTIQKEEENGDLQCLQAIENYGHFIVFAKSVPTADLEDIAS